MEKSIATHKTLFVIVLSLVISQSAIARTKKASYVRYLSEEVRAVNKNKEQQDNSVSQKENFQSKNIEVANWELRTAPIAFMAKWVTLDLSYRMSQNFSLGPSVILYNSPKGERGGMLAPAFNGYAAGINGMYYFDSVMRNTWYTSIHTYYEQFSSYGHGTEEGERTEKDGFKGNTAIGYQFRWATITMLVGGGLEYLNHNENQIQIELNGNIKNTLTNASGLGPYAEFKIGIEM